MKICVNFLAFLLLWIGFKFSDICPSKLERLSDEQLIDLAFAHLSNRTIYPQIAPIVDGKRLRLSNPKCCTVRRFDGVLIGDQWISRLLGLTRIEIVLTYPIASKNAEPLYYTSYISSNACGRSLWLAGIEED